MATCKECVHKDVCPVPHLKDATICPHFKDCTKYVEVVRCKDCKNAADYPAGVYPFKADSQKLVCTKTVNWRAVEPDHFCSYGERRTE